MLLLQTVSKNDNYYSLIGDKFFYLEFYTGSIICYNHVPTVFVLNLKNRSLVDKVCTIFTILFVSQVRNRNAVTVYDDVRGSRYRIPVPFAHPVVSCASSLRMCCADVNWFACIQHNFLTTQVLITFG